MASLIPGYEYDIFISYRQKDNKGGRQGAPLFGATQFREAGWVSEFVDSLKDELESTFKEEISVYFDVNPHDGLLETHEVADSLKEKLKCLIFIPVLSRTYCDPKSFAWENEFVAFIEQASKDQFGLKVRLPGGNVASRVLPVRIHDLDKDDLDLCESVTGGVLRGVEFIYKSPGVNRPLRPKEDKPQENLNNTIYRDQINKVALAIKDIILGLKSAPAVPVSEEDKVTELLQEVTKYQEPILIGKPFKTIKSRLISGAAVAVILLISVIFIYSKFYKGKNSSDLVSTEKRMTVVVMPFQNMTNDSKLNKWQVGIQNELINNFTNSDQLRIETQESINGLLRSQGITDYSSIKPSVAGRISEKLNANIFISGSINASGTIIRVNAQLTDSKTGDVIKSFKKEGSNRDGDILTLIIDPLAKEIKNFLIISRLKEEAYLDQERTGSSDSPEAYQFFSYGQKAFAKGDFPEAIDMLSKAVKIDSNLTYAILNIGWAFYNQGIYDEAKKWCLRAYRKRDNLPLNQATYSNYVHACFFSTPNEAVKYLKQLQDIDDQWPQLHYDMGVAYSELMQYDRAIPEFEKAVENYRVKNSKPLRPDNYAYLGIAYHKTAQYKLEKKLYNSAEQDFPENPSIIRRQAILALTEGNTTEAEMLLEKYRSVRKENSAPETTIITGIAAIYSEADIPDKAEECYRQVLSMQPDDPESLYNLAWFLIDENRNFVEGLELIDRALGIQPENYLFLDCKGWGLYRQGKIKEAFALIERAWNLKPVYNHLVNLHLEEVKKAVAGMKK